MIDILIGRNEKGEDIFMSSNEIKAVVWPCTSFEKHVIWSDLQKNYGFKESEIIQPGIAGSHLIDWVHLAGERKDINVFIEIWKVKEIPIAFIEPYGDISSWNLTSAWVDSHFDCKWSGVRPAIFDPWNLHNCVEAINEAKRRG